MRIYGKRGPVDAERIPVAHLLSATDPCMIDTLNTWLKLDPSIINMIWNSYESYSITWSSNIHDVCSWLRGVDINEWLSTVPRWDSKPLANVSKNHLERIDKTSNAPESLYDTLRGASNQIIVKNRVKGIKVRATWGQTIRVGIKMQRNVSLFFLRKMK